MKRHIKQHFFILMSAMVFSLLVQGCCSQFISVKRRGKLSDAMEKASDENEEDREVETHYVWVKEEPVIESAVTEDPSASPAAVGNASAVSADSSEQHFGRVLSFSGGSGLLSGSDFYGYNHFNIAYGEKISRRSRIQGYAGYMWAPLQTTGHLHHSLKNGVLLLQLGGEYRYYTTPHYTFMGQYFIGGLSFQYMFWSYKNPILFDGETIRSDSMSGLEIYAGAGINLMQTRYFQLGGEILPGVILWDEETREGFENDIFGAFWHVKFRLSLSFIYPN
ncbi:hypothetical protein JW835_05150 [bacterium]|nr:hypothetical protein [bacterium]